MRIVGGEWRGRRLSSVGKGDTAAHLRPTTDRTRESLFNILINRFGDPITGSRVLDVFAGTGALGLEALSRGATEALFIEQGRKAQAILRENITLLNAPAQILTKDARRPGPAPDQPFELVFLDPPYGKGLGEVAMEALKDWIAPEALVVWEESTAPNAPPWLQEKDQRAYGDTLISFFTKVGG